MSTDPPTSNLTRPETYAFTAFGSITLYNSLELIVLCLATFKKYQGVYFYSLLITSCSLIVNCAGFVLLFLTDVTNYVAVTIILLGWYCMVTGHSVVLWSRLHLVFQQPRVLKGILALIIFNAVALHIPVTVLLYGSATPRQSQSIQDNFSRGYNVIERIQLIIFACQECLLSAIYIFETFKLLRLRPQHSHRVILTQLLIINVIILGLDIVVVVFEYTGLFVLQVVFKPVAYSIKLRLEYAILGRLIEVVKGGSRRNSMHAWNDIDSVRVGRETGNRNGPDTDAEAETGASNAFEWQRQGLGLGTGTATGSALTREESGSSIDSEFTTSRSGAAGGARLSTLVE